MTGPAPSVCLADPDRLTTARLRRIATDQVARAVGGVPPGARVAFDRVGGAVRVQIAFEVRGRTLRAHAVALSPEYALCDARRALQRLAARSTPLLRCATPS